jgi:hypothetical protein
LTKNTLVIIAKNLEFIVSIRSLPMDKSYFINFETNKAGDLFELLIALARYLRGPEGCPWDRKQLLWTLPDMQKKSVKSILRQ